MGMFYYKNLSILKRSLFYLLLINAMTSVSYAKEDATDLGETGFTSSIRPGKIDKDYARQNIFGNVPKNISLEKIKFSYRSALPRHYGPSTTRRLSFRKNLSLPTGAKIFVFSCYDEESLKMAKTADFDYGLCVEYKSMDDIRDFKVKAGMRQPVQIANDEMAKAFGITSYPALITVHDGELEIQEGF